MTWDDSVAKKSDLKPLQDVAAQFAPTIAASDLIHAQQKQEADKATADAATAKQAAADAMTKANAAANTIANIPKVPWLGLRVVNVPALALGASADIAVAWEVPAPGTDYVVATAVEGAASLLGTISAAVKPGSQTVNGCTITVKSTGLLALNAAKINVVAGRSANQA